MKLHGTARSRKTAASVRDAINQKGQGPIAEYVGVDASTVSRWVEKIDQVVAMLEAAGFKCVPTEVKCFDPKDIAAMFHFAKKHLERMQTVDALEFDEDAE